MYRIPPYCHHIGTNDSIKNGCRTKEIEMCIRGCSLCVRARYENRNGTPIFSLDWKKNLQFKSIEFFHFATHIYVRAAHIEAYENLYHSVIGIRCRKTLIQKCVLLVDIEFPRKIVALHQHQHHHHQHRSPQR